MFTLLALLGAFVLRRETAREFPDARVGAATAKLRGWVAQRRDGHHHQNGGSPPESATSIAEQLGQLADLQDRGAISPSEFQDAKTRLLSSAT